MTKIKKNSILYKRFDEKRENVLLAQLDRATPKLNNALLAQLDRASVYGTEG